MERSLLVPIYDNSVLTDTKRRHMASLALAPLISMLKEMQIEIDTSSLSKNESGLFRDLLKLLESESQDPKALKSLIEQLEKEAPAKKEISINQTLKLPEDSEKLYPVEIKREQKNQEPESKTVKKEPLYSSSSFVADLRNSEVFEQLAKSEPLVKSEPSKPNRDIDASKERESVLYARHSSYTFLKKESEETRVVHELRSSATLGDLLSRANEAGLEIVDFDIEIKKESKSQLKPELQKTATPAYTLFQYPERISQSASEVVMPTYNYNSYNSSDNDIGKKIEPSAKRLTPLQNLLVEPEVKKTAPPKTESIGNIKIEKTGSDFASLASNIQNLLDSQSKDSGRIEKASSFLRETPKQEESVEYKAKPDSAPAKSENLQISFPEIKSTSSEQLTQKIVDAKATLKHFAQNLQEQVQNYKPPFTRMQISLDPKELGSVEVTMVSRGNNLHIQVNSNPTAIGIMATHGNELKNQLVSMGFTDVQMQFSMNQQQQQNRQQRHNMGGGYKEVEEIPDFYESLDLIVPHYV